MQWVTRSTDSSGLRHGWRTTEDIAPDVKIEFVQTKGTADIREKITMTALSGATDDLPDAAMLDPVTIRTLQRQVY